MPDGAMRRSFPWLQFDGAELRDEDFFKQAEDDEEFAFCRFRSCSGQSGMYGPPPFCKRKVRMTELVCANVFGLYWSRELLA
jgi:hypothetical protein